MARSRNIKPGFYQNEVLAECSVWARLLFPGLWMLADRSGRLEDRPLRIKAALLPYDGQNVDKLLTELHNRGFIYRYSCEGGKYIQIINFSKHQNPHCKEPDSSIPDPPPECGCTEPVQGEYGARTVLEPDAHSSGPADSGFPLTDSLTPESPKPPSGGSVGVPMVIPSELDTERFRNAWSSWERHRREIKHALTASQRETQLKKLAAEGEPAAVERVERSIANGWRGLWFKGEDSRACSRSRPRDRAAEFLRMGAEASKGEVQ